MMVTHFKKAFGVLLFLIGFNASAQNATLKGQVTVTGSPDSANVSVSLKGTLLGAATDAEGHYEIRNIKPGTYVIRVSSVVYATKERNITLKAGEEKVENFSLSAAAEDLTEVVVEANKTNPFARKESSIVSKMPLKDIENPQVYNTISAELLKEQVVTHFDDALKNAPGIDKLWESTGRGGDGAAYFSLRGFAVQPTMVNGLPGLTTGSPDPANIERIEVIKGPSGTLFGSSLISYGGLINVTTKQAFESFGGNLNYVGGTFGLNRVTVDLNTPLGTSNKAFARINAAYHYENSFQDAGFRKSFFFAPSLKYNISDKVTFLVNSSFYNGRSTNQTMLFVDRSTPLRVHNIEELGYDRKRSYTSNDLYVDTPTYNLQGQMLYKFSPNWTSQTAVSRSSAKSNGYYSYLYEGTRTVEALSGTAIAQGIILGRYTSKQNAETYATDIQQNFIGEFSLGKIKNKFIGGLDYFNTNTVNNGSGYGNQGFVNIGVDPAFFAAVAPALHAAYGSPQGTGTNDTGVLTQAGADAGINGAGPFFSKSKQEIFSAYASEIAYLLPNLSAMASLRLDRFNNEGNLSTESDNYNQTAWSPKFGLVFQPILDKVAIFANYLNGFSNVAPITTPGGQVLSFEAEQANQFEAGAKFNLMGNKFTATASYYTTKVTNTVIQISPEEYTQGGQQVNKGLEFSLAANPVEGFNIIAGYSYNDSRLERSDAADFAGRRPESAGPQNLANLWASYKVSQGLLKGFGLGFGGNYASDNKIFNRNGIGTFTLPEYTVLNASVFYNAADFLFTAKADNLTNKDYYKGWSTISPQKPRIFSMGVTYNF